MLLEWFLFLGAAADEFAAATNLLPADGLSQRMPVFDVFNGIADNGTCYFLLFGELAGLYLAVDQLLFFSSFFLRH